MHELTLKDVGIKDPDLLGLIDRLDAYLYGLYPPEEVFGVDLDDPELADIHFVAAYLDGSRSAAARSRKSTRPPRS